MPPVHLAEPDRNLHRIEYRLHSPQAKNRNLHIVPLSVGKTRPPFIRILAGSPSPVFPLCPSAQRHSAFRFLLMILSL